ncbi:MAG: ThiF family adenylyltransferase [Thermoguttaceae bacterium]
MSSPERYARQVRFPPLGQAGQDRLSGGRALLCGCGALGSTAANILVRAGVGMLRIVDRDFVELSNLQRQTLFDESDAAAGVPKAVAAAEKLRAVNSSVTVEPIVADVHSGNVEQLCQGIDLILDGTDNFETRFLLNDAAVRHDLPWIYGGCVGDEGQTMTILPGETPCLACLIGECPPPGATPTCVTAGILGPIVGVIASIQAMEALKILSGHREAVSRHLTVVELWSQRIRQIDVSSSCRQADCAVCRRRDFAWLDGRKGNRTAVLCGRNAVQLSPAEQSPSRSLDELARRLEGVGRITRNQFLLRLAVDRYELVIFADGRTIVQGTDDITTARAVYAMYVGS